jgi:hypothetical protein
MTAVDVVIVHPATGEVLEDLGRYEPDVLAEAVVLLREQQTELRRMQRAVEDEIKARIAAKGMRRGRVWVVGDYELKQASRSEWDADELEGVLRRLHEDGVLSNQDVIGLIAHEPKVYGSNVDRLLKRLDGEAHAAIEACRQWKPKGLSVERSLPLISNE